MSSVRDDGPNFQHGLAKARASRGTCYRFTFGSPPRNGAADRSQSETTYTWKTGDERSRMTLLNRGAPSGFVRGMTPSMTGDAPGEPQASRATATDYRGNNDYLTATTITSSGLPLLFLDSCFMPRPMNNASPRFHLVLALPSTFTDIASLSPSAITT